MYRTHGKQYSPKQLAEFAALLESAEALPTEPRKTTLSQRVYETFHVSRDAFNEQFLRETKGFTGQIWRGRFVAGQDHRTLAQFCEREGWTQRTDGTWAGPTGKAKLDGNDSMIFILFQEARR